MSSWQDELDARFRLRFEIFDREYVERISRDRGGAIAVRHQLCRVAPPAADPCLVFHKHSAEVLQRARIHSLNKQAESGDQSVASVYPDEGGRSGMKSFPSDIGSMGGVS